MASMIANGPPALYRIDGSRPAAIRNPSRLELPDYRRANDRNRRYLPFHYGFREGRLTTPSRPPERIPSVRFHPL